MVGKEGLAGSSFKSIAEDYYLILLFSPSMEVLDFVTTVVLVTASGALAPGPLFLANLSQGVKSGAKSGLVFSVAHTIVEFTLVMLLALGLLAIAGELTIKLVIGVVGGAVLIAFGVSQIHNSFASKPGKTEPDHPRMVRNAFLIGATFTGLNPFFFIWWLTIGAQIIIISLEFASLAGVVFMYICHVWMDYVWLIATAHLAKKGMNVAGLRSYRFVMAVFGLILVYFGLNFLFSSFRL
ncbi:MAG: LysE family transporter [Candidatus Bathyarchaeota archaeon]|nr:MAG: LysE family transporter [Candidatus Bathyarchaeota archaeon]